MNGILSQEEQNDKRFSSSFDYFFKTYLPKKILRENKFTQSKDRTGHKARPDVLLKELFMLPFEQKSLYQKSKLEHGSTYHINTYYRFLKDQHNRWEDLLQQVAIKAISFFSPLTPQNRHVLVIDDTLFSRPKGKKVENNSLVYDHNEGTFKKGYRLLTLAWTDGFSTVPTLFRMMSSAKTAYKSEKKYDGRGICSKRRADSLKTMTDSAIELLEKASCLGTRYVAYDSWFGTPKTILRTTAIGYDVVCMMKINNTFNHHGKIIKAERLLPLLNKSVDITRFSNDCKIQKNIIIIGSINVCFKNDQAEKPVKLVFCKLKGHQDSDFSIVACTDISLSPQEILELYAKRWSIETSFKIDKQFFGLTKETFTLNFDVMVAFTSIQFLRHIMLARERRMDQDSRTIGPLFFALIEEIKDDAVINAVWNILLRVISAYDKSSQEYKNLIQVVNCVLSEYINSFPEYIKQIFPLDSLLFSC